MLYPTQFATPHPDKIAYRMVRSGESVTFRELDERSNRAAQLFRACGVGRGDHILVLMENNRQFLEVCFGADRAGIYYTAVSTHLVADEVAYILRDCGAKLVVTSRSQVALMELLRARLPDIAFWFMIGADRPGFADWDDAVSAQPATPVADEWQGLDMLYSSGTTGRPKGIKWPLPERPPGGRTMLVDLLSRLFEYRADTRYLSPAPLYHAAPMRHSMTVIKQGGTVFVMEKFDAEEALATIERERITHSQWVPTMFVRMLKLSLEQRARYDMSSIRMAIHAAAPCPIDVKERMIAWWGPILHEYYAGTENNGFCAIDTQEWLAHKGSVGRAVQGELRICDEHGVELPIGEEGEVYFANGPQFVYHNDPAKTAASRNAKGWTTLGDIGRLDADGYLYLVDRKSFLIISGGVNIYPQEIEDTILSHPKVADVAVIGVPNEDFGEEVKAVVQPLDMVNAGPALAEEIIAYCKARIAAYKCPRSVDFRAVLPRHPTGKLFKRQLKQQYWPVVVDARL
ncbi:MAG: AMP-binding protein [Magnetospirillum sp.]|nr:AMP-binding protein [Magnetospirillum sp.]